MLAVQTSHRHVYRLWLIYVVHRSCMSTLSKRMSSVATGKAGWIPFSGNKHYMCTYRMSD